MSTQTTTTQIPDENIQTTTTQAPDHTEETITVTKKPRFELGIRHRIIIVAAAVVISLMVYLILPSKKVAVTPTAVNQAENVNPDSTTTTPPSTPSTNPTTDGYAVNSSGTTPPPLAAPDVTSATLTPATPNLPNALPPPANPNPMNDQLTNINQQLQTIETTLSTQDNSQVQGEIQHVITEIGNMMSDSTTTLNTAIQSSEQSLASQLNGMQGQLSNIQQLSQPGSYIDPSNLPFTLLFIDNVSGQNVVTVNYNNITTPLSAGQSLAGWKLTTADYASQYAVFQNAKDQLVKVSNTGAQ